MYRYVSFIVSPNTAASWHKKLLSPENPMTAIMLREMLKGTVCIDNYTTDWSD